MIEVRRGKGMGSCHKEVCMGRLESQGAHFHPLGVTDNEPPKDVQKGGIGW